MFGGMDHLEKAQEAREVSFGFSHNQPRGADVVPTLATTTTTIIISYNLPSEHL